LRLLYEKELTKDREKHSYLLTDLEQEKKQYLDLKGKLKQRNT